MKSNFSIAFIFFAIVLNSCAVERPMVRMEKGISLSDYKTFQVELTSNGTNTSIPDIISAGSIIKHLYRMLWNDYLSCEKSTY